MKLLVKFPTRNRPAVFRSTLEAYRRLSTWPEMSFLVSIDSDDPSMTTPEMRSYLDSIPNLKYIISSNKSKIQAINANMENIEFDTLLLASDDMVPQVHGYDRIICEQMAKHFPNLDGCLHFNDGRVGRVLNTLVIMGRELYKQWGYIYHPDYVSLWCDNEFQQVTEAQKKSIYVDQVIIKHAWTSVTGNDQLHNRNEAYYKKDKATFEARKARGFPRESCLAYAVPLSQPEQRSIQAATRPNQPQVRRPVVPIVRTRTPIVKLKRR